MKLRYILLIAVATIATAIYAFKVFAPELNKPTGASTFKTFVKEGVPARMQWYKTDNGFHFLSVFKDGYVAHGTSIFLGAIGHGDTVKLECKPVSEHMCTNSKLIGLDLASKQPHPH